MARIPPHGALLLGASTLAFSAAPAAAGGFALEQQNARAMGAAFAGVQARRGDPGYAVYNPAAILGVTGVDLSLNASGVWSQTSYENAGGALLGAVPIAGSAGGSDFDGDAVVPNLSLALPLGERAAFGLVVHAPFGLKTDFDAASALRYQAQASEALSVAISPTLALRLTDAISIGASLRVQYFDLSVTAAIDAAGVAAASMIPGFIPGTDDVAAAFDGDDVAIGYTAGFQAELSPRLTIGGSYASAISHDIEGDAVFDFSASVAGQTLNIAAGLFAPTDFTSELNTPAIAGLGLEFAATERVTLLASTTYSRWSTFKDVALVFANPAQPPEILAQNWNDGWSFSVGGEFQATGATMLRAGFMYDDSPVNDAFASPRIPDADRYWVAAGLTQEMGERLSADVGVAVAFFADRRIDLPGTSPEALFRGSLAADLETTAFAAALRLRYRF